MRRIIRLIYMGILKQPKIFIKFKFQLYYQTLFTRNKFMRNTLKASSHLVLGGARSGKSSYAEQLAKTSDHEIIYIATAKIMDNEIAQRVTRHKKDRPDHWITVEEPLALADKIQEWADPERLILVDCLTMWLMNLLSDDSNQQEIQLHAEQQNLLEVISNLNGQLIIVSNEVGMGIIPLGELTRKYVDEAGRLHQALAKIVDNVTLITAGLPLKLK